MKDQKREILNQVAAGKITADEGAARLESLDTLESGETHPIGSSRLAPVPDATTKRISVVSQIGSTEIVGDASVAFVVAEGPHRARQEGDTIVIEHAPIDDSDHFQFGRGDRRFVINGMDFGRRKVMVRMNPRLALSATAGAGSLRVEGVKGAITAEVLGGSCRISGFEGPIDLSIQAGNLSASGRLDEGASKIRCEMGNVTINLEKGSSVRVTARTTMGKVAIDSDSGDPVMLGQTGKDVTVGAGKGTLDIECTMGNVRVSAQ